MVRTAAGTAVLLVLCLLAAAPARAADPTGIQLGTDGKTAPVFGYAGAIREHVLIPVAGVDQDFDGVDDHIAVDVIRPSSSGAGFRVPAIIDPSPYYTTLGRGNEAQKIADIDLDGLNDVWPTFIDNYFVPRGYAVVLADMDGTGHSTGCALQGGPGDIASMKAVVDWLNGRVTGRDAAGNLVSASWHNGKAAMIGKSYDGTLANGVAATGVDGLTTIVSESAISDWYGYSRMGGIRFNTHYPKYLSRTVTNSDRQTACSQAYAYEDANDGDATGDLNPFWDDRDYLPDVGKVKASVLVSHGIDDDNVRLDQMARWWAGLAAHDVPRKLWLSQEGHVDPFDYRRAEWVDTLHRWFDHWLWGVDNGIMSEPRVDIETSADQWRTYADWPLPGTSDVDVAMGAQGADKAGSLAVGAATGGTDSLAFTDLNLTESTAMSDPDTVRTGRLAFLSPPLSHDVHLSGTPVVDLHASLDTPQSNLGAILVDYGDGTHVTRAADGIANTTTRTCWGLSSSADSACFLEVRKPLATGSVWRITHGILDSSNRDSLRTGSPVVPGDEYDFRIPLVTTDYDVPAGHRIGVVVVANDTSFPSIRGTTGATVSVDTHASKVVLPVVGGQETAVRAFDVTPPTASATVSGGDGWTAGPRTVTLRASDEPGGSGLVGIAWSKSGAETSEPAAVSGGITTVDVAAEGVTTVHYHGIDWAGNSGPDQTIDVKIDKSPPAISCAAPDGSWHPSDVTIDCTATDAGSGLADAGDAAFTLSTHVPAGTHDADASTGSRTVCDVVGNCATAGPIGGNKVDPAGPSMVAEVGGGSGWAGPPRTVTLRAADEPGGSGVAHVTWSLSGAENAAPRTVDGDTATIRLAADGVTTVHYHATDGAGNAGPDQTVEVRVDAAAPVVHCDEPDTAWHTQNVVLACTASDAESGLADVRDAAFTLSTHVPQGGRDVDATTDSRQVCDLAGNCATAGPAGGNEVDLSAAKHKRPRIAHIAGATLRFPRTVTLGRPFSVRITGPRRRVTFRLELREHGRRLATAHATLGRRVRLVELRTRRLMAGTATLVVSARRPEHRARQLRIRLPVR